MRGGKKNFSGDKPDVLLEAEMAFKTGFMASAEKTASADSFLVLLRSVLTCFDSDRSKQLLLLLPPLTSIENNVLQETKTKAG